MKHWRLDHLARGVLVAAAVTAPTLALSGRAAAQGFGLNEIGSCAVARAGAGVAAPCEDASRIYWNPAAAIRLPGTVNVLAGVAGVAVDGAFTQDLTGVRYPGDVPVEYPPHVFANYKVQSRFALGFGVYVPYGLTSQWGTDFPGRFSALKASLASIYLQPNFAFDVVPGRLAIGGGPVIGISDVELTQALELSTTPTGATLPDGTPVTFGMLGVAPGTEFGRATLQGQALAWGFNLGVHWQLADALALGARYLSEIDFEYKGATAEFTQTPTGLVVGGTVTPPFSAGTPVDAILQGLAFGPGGALTTRGVQTSIAHPAQAQVGLGYTGLPNTTVNLDYVWVGWKAFDELPVDFQPNGSATEPPDRTLIEDYDDSWAVRGSVDYTFANGWAGHVGSSFTSSPAPDVTVTPLLPDMDRYNFAGGLTIPFGGRYALDASYLRVETKGRRGRILERESRSQTAAQLNSGWYELNANVFSVSLKATW
ncbi:MAG TPA: outer membrane protein transport protein [Gemmatimonadaceae bacterium]|nr:outer membrane protein transport protein [Gemmatimonadaceae bacterium]